MTSQQDIQSLIADIDSILHKPDTRLPWSKLGDIAQERRVLERVRSYLVSQQHVAKPDRSPAANSASPEVVQQLAQAVRQEMHGLRTDLFDHLRTDIEALRHERENLIEEIRQLERHKQQMPALAQNQTVPEQAIAEVSQALINHCTESLTQQIAQVLASWELHLTGAYVKPSIASSTQPKLLTPAATNQSQLGSVLHPQERIEHLRQLQAQFDQMLLTLDANQRAIFDALQRNLQSYQQSLGQGLEKMHSLGVQGEMLFAALVHRLAQPLEQDSSTPIPTSQQQSELAPSTEQELPLNLLSETQTPQHPLKPAESLTPPESSISAAATQGEHNQAEAIAQGNSFENLHTGDWEAIEGLDLDDLEVEPEDDGLETFIQLDMNARLSRPAIIEQAEAPHRDPQAPDSGELDTDSHRQEIEELYQSLFGTEALASTAKLEAADLPVAPALQLPKDDQGSRVSGLWRMLSISAIRD